MDRYYYSKEGNDVQGPISAADLDEMCSAGILPVSTQVCREGTETWQPITEVLTLTTTPPHRPLGPSLSSLRERREQLMPTTVAHAPTLCPFCRKEIEIAATVCPYCTRNVGMANLARRNPIVVWVGFICAILALPLGYIIHKKLIDDCFNLDDPVCCAYIAIIPIGLFMLYGLGGFLIGFSFTQIIQTIRNEPEQRKSPILIFGAWFFLIFGILSAIGIGISVYINHSTAPPIPRADIPSSAPTRTQPTPTPKPPTQDALNRLSVAIEEARQKRDIMLAVSKMNMDISVSDDSYMSGDTAVVNVEVKLLSADAQTSYIDGTLKSDVYPSIKACYVEALRKNGFLYTDVGVITNVTGH